MTTPGPATARLFHFLQEHRAFNRAAQREFLRRTLSHPDRHANAVHLLGMAANTASQVDMDKWGPWLRDASATAGLDTFQGFCGFLGIDPAQDDLFDALKARGWGDKTGALLVRSIALIARERPLARALWPDLRVAALRATRIRLPVDRVIIAIFAALKENHPQEFEAVRLATPGGAFKTINAYLGARYPDAEDMLLWDDLWFWGFVTQRGAGDERTMGWNENKYWMQFHAMPQLDAGQVEAKALEFLALVAPAAARRHRR